MIDRNRPGIPPHRCDAHQGHQRTGLAAHIDLAQVGFALLARIGVLHDHRVAVAAGKYRRHLTVTIGAVQGGANILNLYPGIVGAVAIDIDHRLQPIHLRIAGDIAEDRFGPHLGLQLFGPVVQFLRAHAL